MKIVFHGAAREVGKSCIEIQSEGKRYLLDMGVKFVQGGLEFPKFLEKEADIDAVFLSHAHLDHSGALPMLEHHGYKGPIYMTDLTWKITRLMLADEHHLDKIKHPHPAFSERDLKGVEIGHQIVEYDRLYATKDNKVKFRYLNAGHIPGSASILLEVEGKRILYTGDVNTEDTILMKPADFSDIGEIDILISENTYGERVHPDRDDIEVELVKAVKECLSNGGSVLMPAFSVGRAQEMLMILDEIDKNVPIYMDGLGKKITRLLCHTEDPYVDNKEKLQRCIDRVIFVDKPQDRHKIGRKKGIVMITSSGMCQGGPVMTYMDHFIHDDRNFIILNGFQAAGTRGRTLFEDHVWHDHGKNEKVKAHVRKYDFSAHLGQDNIRKMYSDLKPKNILLVHGDLEAVESSKRWATENTDSKTEDPYIGEEYEF